MAKTLFDKIWDAHVIEELQSGNHLFYIDTHLIHEVTSPQAFAQIEEKNIAVLRPKQTYATVDHNVPTLNQHLPIKDELSRKQVATLAENCEKHNIQLFGLGNENQGIVHVIAPEQGITQPGNTIVCGDSHTSTHGAFATVAFGIGTSQVAQVFASQSLILKKPKKMRINVNGKLSANVLPKDVILYIIAKIGTNAGTGYFVEYAGDVFENMSMEGRMTVCNMSIEMGARGGLIAFDETTKNYLKDRKYIPKGDAFNNKVQQWSNLKSDADAKFDKEFSFDASDIEPMITFGTNPGMGIKINETIPQKNSESFNKALKYMDFEAGASLKNKQIDYVFIGSCTNSRIEDFRVVANYIKGEKKAENIEAIIVPGSQKVLQQIMEEGLDKIFEAANLKIRQPGCSSCLAMNEDKIPPGKYCVSTSNRNFEGRQGIGSRTILASPLTAAAVAINGKIVNV